MSIWKEDYELMHELRNYSTTYCTFIESGGKAGSFADAMINKTIAVSMKIKENRDFIERSLGRSIPTAKEEIETAKSILNGTFKDDRLASVISRVM